MKIQLQFFAIVISMDSFGQARTAPNGVRQTETPTDLSMDTTYMLVLGENGNICLDSIGEDLFFKVPYSISGTELNLSLPQNYPAYLINGEPYIGERYSAEMPDSLFNVYLDSLREADFCFSDSASAEDGYLPNRVVDFVYNHKGRKVGTGICFDLIKEAYEYSDTNWMEKWDNKEKFEVAQPDIEEGDVIHFENVMLADSSLIPAHVGIVCGVLEGGHITYADQNSSGGEQEYVQYYRRYMPVDVDSRVVMNDLDLRQDILSGRVRFFRF